MTSQAVSRREPLDAVGQRDVGGLAPGEVLGVHGRAGEPQAQEGEREQRSRVIVREN